uniref:RRM domain-containing protein n=1 Tax=Macrostomum lignano TaxID=282301 RepID=A0A1I8IP45_9PLAT
ASIDVCLAAPAEVASGPELLIPTLQLVHHHQQATMTDSHAQDDSDDIAESAVVRLRGVPYKATVADIEEFFSSRLRGCQPASVHIVYNAFVEFVDPGEAEAALSLNKQYIGHRYVEIFPSNLAEMKRTLHQQSPQPAAKRSSRKATPVVKLTGLPESAAAHAAVLQTLLSCCPGVRIAPDGLLLVFDRFQQFTGCAFVQLLGAEDARLVLDTLAAGGDSVRELTASLSSSREAYREANRQHLLAGHDYSTGPFGEGGLDPNDLSDCCDIEDSDPIEESEPTSFGSIRQRDASPSLLHGVRVRGLPWSANDTDLAEFFAPLKPCLATVARSADGRSLGTGTASFYTAEDAQAAVLNCHKKLMGERYIEVYKQ